MIDGRFDQHFIELFAEGDEDPLPDEPEATGPLLLAALVAGLVLLACLPFLT